ncbi:hypothetical protein [Rivihabitans pingtungensis]|uniref:hypothetical protein n=1 Tax=Rivihabitans pingtungensis TaxID=1054498 RepID=UPI0011B7704C|nr:hypothetical protein [Rivihabitans pingtungensis]
MAEKSASGRAAVRETLYFVKNLLHIVVATMATHHAQQHSGGLSGVSAWGGRWLALAMHAWLLRL